MSLKNKSGYNDFVIWLREQVLSLEIDETNEFIISDSLKIWVKKGFDFLNNNDPEVIFYLEYILNNSDMLDTIALTPFEILNNDNLLKNIYEEIMVLQDEVKQCSKCQYWFAEEELKTTNLADGDFCEQCLQDLKEMR